MRADEEEEGRRRTRRKKKKGEEQEEEEEEQKEEEEQERRKKNAQERQGGEKVRNSWSRKKTRKDERQVQWTVKYRQKRIGPHVNWEIGHHRAQDFKGKQGDNAEVYSLDTTCQNFSIRLHKKSRGINGL